MPQSLGHYPVGAAIDLWPSMILHPSTRLYSAPLLLPVPSFWPISTQIILLISTSFSNSGTARSPTSNYSRVSAIFDPGETDPVPAPSNSLIVDQSGR